MKTIKVVQHIEEVAAALKEITGVNPFATLSCSD